MDTSTSLYQRLISRRTLRHASVLFLICLGLCLIGAVLTVMLFFHRPIRITQPSSTPITQGYQR